MDADKTCSGCGQPLADDAPQGLCPECLIRAGLETGVPIGPDTQSRPANGVPFAAPTVEELARAFPELEMLSLVGQGGMGAVYKARQKALDRIVALKVLPPGIGADPAFANRFAREAKALAKLNHPGIVTLFEFGKAGGLYFFLMEFVDGVNLHHLLETKRLSPREALAIVPQICDALQYAHDHGIVHRDIKPENILLDRQGRVKVADFGLAKLVGTGTEPAAEAGAPADVMVLTQAGAVMGTPQYMAPEQVETPAAADHRADIYSLGVVLYQMLTGELPGEPIQPPSRRVQMDVRIDEIVMRALETTPEMRYQSAAELRAQVETTADPAARPAVSAPRAAPQSTWVAFAVAVTCFFAALPTGILLASALPFGGSSEWACLLLVAVMAVAAPFAGTAASRALRHAARTGDTDGLTRMASRLRALATVALLLSVPAVGFGVFFLFAMTTESGGWHPATSEAVLVPLTWLGALLLPLAGWRLLQALQDLRTTTPPVSPTRSSLPLLKVGKGTITTPRKLATADEQFFHALREKGQILLDDRHLTFSGAGKHTVIPLAAIRDLSTGHYPRVMNPAGLHFISVTYDQDGQATRVFITPMEVAFGLPSHFNQVVADWFTAIRDAATAVTGRVPGETPAAALGTPSSSPVLIALLLSPLVVALVGVAALTRQCGTPPPAAEEPPAAGTSDRSDAREQVADYRQILGTWEVVSIEGTGGRFMSLDGNSKPGDRLLIPHVRVPSRDHKSLTRPGQPERLVLHPKAPYGTLWASEARRQAWTRDDSLHLYPEADPRRFTYKTRNSDRGHFADETTPPEFGIYRIGNDTLTILAGDPQDFRVSKGKEPTRTSANTQAVWAWKLIIPNYPVDFQLQPGRRQILVTLRRVANPDGSTD